MHTSNSRVGSKSLPTLQDDHLVDQYLAACREVVYLNAAQTLALARHPGHFPSERRTSWRVCFSGTSINAAIKCGEISTLCFASSVPLSPTLAGRVARCIGPPFRKHAACGAEPLLHPLLRFKCALVPNPSPIKGEGLKLPSPLVGQGHT